MKKQQNDRKKDTKVEETDRNAAAEKYMDNCRKFGVQIDPSVVISLQTGWNILEPTKQFNEGSMLPLMDVLNNDKYITELNLSTINPGNGNSNARVLGEILQTNTSIKSLDLSSTGLRDDGLKELCKALSMNKSVTKLNISSNNFGSVGAKYLVDVVSSNPRLEYLDLSRNALGFLSINNILCSCSQNLTVSTHGNYVFEEILNSLSHGIAFFFSILAANLLISEAVDVYKTDFHFWACVLYSFSMMFLFLSSCLFHSFFMLPRTSRVLQVLDHVGIYFLIAGSYTPICLITLNHHTKAIVVIIAEWIAAILGSIFATCSDLNHPHTTIIELCIFVAMGCGGFMSCYFEIAEEFNATQLTLLGLTALFYLGGIIFYILGEQRPIYHVIWHVCVMIAACLHWFNIYFFVVPTEINSPMQTAVADMVNNVAFSNIENAAASVSASMSATMNDAGQVFSDVSDIMLQAYNATAGAVA